MVGKRVEVKNSNSCLTSFAGHGFYLRLLPDRLGGTTSECSREASLSSHTKCLAFNTVLTILPSCTSFYVSAILFQPNYFVQHRDACLQGNVVQLRIFVRGDTVVTAPVLTDTSSYK